MVRSSKEAVDLIIEFEISSRSAYERKYKYPEWPGGQSGVTIGLGYDIGYKSVQQFFDDWQGLIPEDDCLALSYCCGLKGEDAKNYLRKVKTISIPWDVAYKVFEKDLERNYEYHVNKLPNSQQLSADSFGALTSLVYNRGPHFNDADDRFVEMRNIKQHMADEMFQLISGEFRAMKRLWKNKGLDGLLTRRDAEADLFERGLQKPITKNIEIEEGNETSSAGGPFSWIKNWLWFKG